LETMGSETMIACQEESNINVRPILFMQSTDLFVYFDRNK